MHMQLQYTSVKQLAIYNYNDIAYSSRVTLAHIVYSVLYSTTVLLSVFLLSATI